MSGQHNEIAADMLNIILAIEFKIVATEIGSSRISAHMPLRNEIPKAIPGFSWVANTMK